MLLTCGEKFRLAAALCVGCDTSPCEAIKSDQQAVERARAYILERGIPKIIALGGDSSIVNASTQGFFPNCGLSPPRYHYVSHYEPGVYTVFWINCIRGDCDSCWEPIVVMIEVTPCGRIQFYSAFRRPNFEQARWKETNSPRSSH